MRMALATRYVTPLREGGSLPGLMEADDDGLYVVKFRGAGQGPRALVAELLGGEIARALGLPMPDIVFIELDPALGRNEPDYEIRSLILASAGRNLGIDFLPGALPYSAAAPPPLDADLASRIVWFDGFVSNVDRTARNTNMLMWHRQLHLIDHGAALYFHHNWETAGRLAESAFPAIRNHVLLPWADAIEAAAEASRERLNRDVFAAILDDVPDGWLTPEHSIPDAPAKRAAYVGFLTRRLDASSNFVQEAVNARASLV